MGPGLKIDINKFLDKMQYEEVKKKPLHCDKSQDDSDVDEVAEKLQQS